MNNKPFDLSVPQEDLNLAKAWWASLSINQMKAFRDEYFPAMSWHLGERWVHQIWESKGKPLPQNAF